MKRFTDLMIDTETLGIGNYAPIIQIGWCFFNRNNDQKYYTRSWSPDIQEQIDNGSSVEWSTLEWWSQQPTWANQVLADRQPRNQVCEQMAEVFTNLSLSNTLIWAKGTPFDIPKINHFMGYEAFDFRNIHDMRTLQLMTPQLQVDITNETPHDAESDALHQAKVVQSLWKLIPCSS